MEIKNLDNYNEPIKPYDHVYLMKKQTFQRGPDFRADSFVSLLELSASCPGSFVVIIISRGPHITSVRSIGTNVVSKAGFKTCFFLLRSRKKS